MHRNLKFTINLFSVESVYLGSVYVGHWSVHIVILLHMSDNPTVISVYISFTVIQVTSHKATKIQLVAAGGGAILGGARNIGGCPGATGIPIATPGA